MASNRRVVSMNCFVIVFLCCCVGVLGAPDGYRDGQGRMDTRDDGGRYRDSNVQSVRRQDSFVDEARAGVGQSRQGQQPQLQDQQLKYSNNRKTQFADQTNNRPNNNLGMQPQPPVREQFRQKPSARRSPVKISEHPDCAQDVKTLCSGSSHNNNFAVLDCLQNDVKVRQRQLGILPRRAVHVCVYVCVCV